ncbi:hypothetical protein C8J56DRAFT_900518 [Mycena floridula]|nr:hypothetical protein C8J56DRAFT_900518 [Mycena floridula]
MEIGGTILAYFTIAQVLQVVLAYGRDTLAQSKEKDLFLSELEALSNVLSALKFLLDGKSATTEKDLWIKALEKLNLFEDDAVLHKTLVEIAEKLGVPSSEMTSPRQSSSQVVTSNRKDRAIAKVKAIKNLAIWALVGKEELVELLARVQRMYQLVDVALSASSAAQLIEISKLVEKGMSNLHNKVIGLVDGLSLLDNQVKKLEERAQRRENQKSVNEFIEWLKPVNNQGKHRNVCSQKRIGTCAWLQRHFDYVSFLPQEISCVCLVNSHELTDFTDTSNIAGTGKSVLCSSVIESLRLSNCPHVIYHYCDFRDSASTNVPTILGSLLSQLIIHNPDPWCTKLSHHLMMNGQLNPASLPSTSSELVDWILEGLDMAKSADADHRQYIVVDALDECQDSTGFIPHLLHIASHSSASLFVSSRHERDIVDLLEGEVAILLDTERSHISADISVHILRELEDRKLLKRLTKTLKDEIARVLTEKANGMFRWVQCQLDSLVDCRHALDVRQALNNLPQTLYATYERILTSIDTKANSSETQMARTILRWLVGSDIPLTLSELNSVLLIEVGKSKLNEDLRLFDELDVLSICKSLISMDEGRGTVSLSHFTVKEFLAQDALSNLQLMHYRVRGDCPDLHKDLALQCLTYLLLEDFASGAASAPDIYSEILQNFPFLPYAAARLSHHLSFTHAEDSEIYIPITELLFDPSLQKYALWAQTEGFVFHAEYFTRKRDPLTVVESWITQRWSPPFFVVTCGAPWIARRIFTACPEWINEPITSPSVQAGSPIHSTIHYKAWDMMDLLLELDADINKPELIYSVWGQRWITPLERALPVNDRVTQMLLDRGAKVGVDHFRSVACHGLHHLLPALFARCPPSSLSAQERFSVMASTIRFGRPDTLRALVQETTFWHPASMHIPTEKGLMQLALEARALKCIDILFHAGEPLTQIAFEPHELSWASGEAWYTQVLEALQVQHKSLRSFEDQQLCDVFWALKAAGLPQSVVLVIMDLAKFWVCISNKKDEVVAVDMKTEESAYVQVTLPSNAVSVRSITFITVSHDQGFSGESEDTKGTYSSSYTWFEATIHRGSSKIAHQVIQDNIQASLQWRKHINTWEIWTHNSELRAWMAILQPGDIISLIPKAMYAAWVNYIQSAELSVCYTFSGDMIL